MEASSGVLKPCVGETTKEGDSSKLEDAAEPMEVVVNSYLTKRKAELDPEEEEERDGGEIEEEGTKAEEHDADEILRSHEWDVDSFDGMEYCSSPDYEIFSPLSDEDEAVEDYRIVKRQLIESKGFYVEPGRRLLYLFKGIKPMSLDRMALPDKTFREYWEEMVFVCLQKHNQDKDPKLEFVEVVRGNYRGGPRSKSYITFMARGKTDGPLVEYQAKCMETLDQKSHPILCRRVPKPFRTKSIS